MKKYFWTILIIVLISIAAIRTLIVSLDSPTAKELCWNCLYDALQKEINGKVINKYKDSNNHFFETIEIAEKEKTIKWEVEGEINGLFLNAELGDSIKKEKNSLEVLIRKERKDTIIVFDYGCNK